MLSGWQNLEVSIQTSSFLISVKVLKICTKRKTWRFQLKLRVFQISEKSFALYLPKPWVLFTKLEFCLIVKTLKFCAKTETLRFQNQTGGFEKLENIVALCLDKTRGFSQNLEFTKNLKFTLNVKTFEKILSSSKLEVSHKTGGFETLVKI